MNSIVMLEEEHFVSKQRCVLTSSQLMIPGIRLLGHQISSSAWKPLIMHFHENVYEFMIVTEGLFSLRSDDKEYKVYGGDIFIAPPGKMHSSNQAPMPMGEFYWLQLDISCSKNILFLNEEASRHLIQQLDAISSSVIHVDSKKVQGMIKEAFRMTSTIENRYMIAGCIYYFLSRIIEYSKIVPVTLTCDIDGAVDFILNNYANAITLEELAIHSNLSVSQFKQKFKRQVGVSPRCFINLQKIEQAKFLLLKNCSKTDIAMQLGFSSSSYFATVF